MNDTSPDRPSALAPEMESRPGLLRALGPGMAIAMVVGNVIGSGIFLKPGVIATETGQFPLILTAWIVGGCLCILGSLCFAELAVMMPQAGGLYVYLREAYGRPFAFLFGFSEFIFGRPASIGALAVAFVGAFSVAAGLQMNTVTSIVCSLGLIAIMSWVNIIGVIWGGRVQAGTTLIKAGFLGVIALLPFVLLAFGSPGFDTHNYATTVLPQQPTAITQFAAAMLAVMWAYNGWHGITPVAEEVRNPSRNIPFALFGGIGILIVLYLSVNIAYHGVLTMPEMAAAGKDAAQAMVRKLLLPIGDGTAQFGVAAISAVIMCSTFGAINSNILNGPRIAFAMGRDDVFARALGRVHVNYRTPVTAILVMGVMSALLIAVAGAYAEFAAKETQQTPARTGTNESATAPVTGETNEKKPAEEAAETRSNAMGQVFEMLTNFVIFSATIFYMSAVAAVIVLRRRHPEWKRPYRTLGYPVVPILYLSFYSWFLYRVYAYKPLEARTGVLLILLGLPVYFGYRAWAKRHPETMHDGE